VFDAEEPRPDVQVEVKWRSPAFAEKGKQKLAQVLSHQSAPDAHVGFSPD